jgi:E3 ubiquitin-protein ligase BAH
MKFGQEYAAALAREEFPQHWLDSAIEYKQLKKCIKKVQRELESIGLDAPTIEKLAQWLHTSDEQQGSDGEKSKSKDGGVESTPTSDLNSIPEEFTPQLRVLVDSKTGTPLDATLAPETRANLEKLARSEMLITSRHAELGHAIHHVNSLQPAREGDSTSDDSDKEEPAATKWITIPLVSAKNFFDTLEPKLDELEALNEAEEKKLEMDILDLGDMVEDVTEPVREGFEAKRKISYRDLYFWREMFRLYLEKPIFYSETERNRGALSFDEAKRNLQAYDEQLRSTGLLAKMRTPLAKRAAQRFLDLNVDILRIMHFQEMNARAMRKILKKFDKRTHLEGQMFMAAVRKRHPALLTGTGNNIGNGFANSIARDLQAELSTKVLAIVPQLEDWTCPVCLGMAWRPVSLGCCRSVFCIRCIIQLQDQKMMRCPCCNTETVMAADGRNLDFETMDFLEKYFPLEVKKRQKENERALLERTYGEEFVRPPQCVVM